MLLQGTAPGILGGIVKGLKGGKADKTVDLIKTPKSTFDHLEGIFLKSSHSDLFPPDHEEAEELDIGSLQVLNSPYSTEQIRALLTF